MRLCGEFVPNVKTPSPCLDPGMEVAALDGAGALPPRGAGATTAPAATGEPQAEEDRDQAGGREDHHRDQEAGEKAEAGARLDRNPRAISAISSNDWVRIPALSRTPFVRVTVHLARINSCVA